MIEAAICGFVLGAFVMLLVVGLFGPKGRI